MLFTDTQKYINKHNNNKKPTKEHSRLEGYAFNS